MTPPSDPPDQATIGAVFRVVNEMRREQQEFRGSVEGQLEEIRRRLEGQTESALNVALHVLGEQRAKLREVVGWANSQGADIEPLP